MAKKSDYPKNLRGMKRHRTSGHPANEQHFTGKSRKKGTKRKRKSSRKQRRAKRTHKNKFK